MPLFDGTCGHNLDNSYSGCLGWHHQGLPRLGLPLLALPIDFRVTIRLRHTAGPTLWLLPAASLIGKSSPVARCPPALSYPLRHRPLALIFYFRAAYSPGLPSLFLTCSFENNNIYLLCI
jgi:hypothetical protein